MSDKYPFLPDYLEKGLEDVSIPLIDLMHGYLKNEMLDVEQLLDGDNAWKEFSEIAKEEEEDGYSDAMVSMERTYAEGYAEALSVAYFLIYDEQYEPVGKDVN